MAAFALAGLTGATACAPVATPHASPVPNGTGTLVADSIPLWYRVAGTPRPGTPPVLFLHGGPGQGSEHFERFVGPLLERALQVVYFDQRASGRSGQGDPSLYTLDKLVSDIEMLRRRIGAPRVALVGHSFGGTLALEYAARFPEHVSSVVFAAGLWDAAYQTQLRCARTNREFRGVAARTLGDSAAAAASAAHDCRWTNRLPRAERDSLDVATMFPDPRIAQRLDSLERATGRRNSGRLGMALGRAGLGRYRFAAFERVTAPVLVISGRHDGAAVTEGLRRLVSHLPNARLIEYEASGHFVYLDEPDRFARDVTRFVGSP